MTSKFKWIDIAQQFKPISEMLSEHFIKPTENKMEAQEKYLRKDSQPRKQRSKPSQALTAMMSIERVMKPLSEKEIAMVRSWFLDNWPFEITAEVPES